MNYTTGLIVILDACVLYSAPLRDILLNLAEQELYVPKWSPKIEEEWIENLLLNRPDIRRENLEKTKQAMNQFFPDAMVYTFEDIIDTIELPDENDRHILAAAIKCKADLIVTFNLKDFPQHYLNQFDIIVVHPDMFLLNLLELDEKRVIIGFENQLASLRDPPKTKTQLKAILKKCGLTKSVEYF